MQEEQKSRNADLNTYLKSQIAEELGEVPVLGAGVIAAQKFGSMPTRLDKNFWRTIQKPAWYVEVEGEQSWNQKKSEVLLEVNKLIRKQLMAQSRQQGRPQFQKPGKPGQKPKFNQARSEKPSSRNQTQNRQSRPTNRPFHDSLRNRTFGNSGGFTSPSGTTA